MPSGQGEISHGSSTALSEAQSSHQESRIVTVLRHEFDGVVGSETFLEQRDILRVKKRTKNWSEIELSTSGVDNYSRFDVNAGK